MAKLHNYYILCPLIDQKSFLGVSKDREDEHVIVTLGRNVVNKYRLSDQKQISGWTSRDHITAPVVHDSTKDNYVGVFNNNTIKTWTEDATNLDKLKKYKFPINILKLLPRKGKAPLIIFTNGNSASLPYAIENRKTYESKSLLKDSDEIIDISCCELNATDYICYIIKNGIGHDLVSCSLREELGDLEKSNFHREKITRSDHSEVVGVLVYKEEIYVLWNDAKITIHNISTKSWKVIGTVPWISTDSAVSMAKMGKDHLVLFGTNKSQEGAIIVAYNSSLGVGSCRYPMKMYRENAKLYCYHQRIILEASNHIGMLPFTLETKRNLSSLLGSHEIMIDETPEIADWNIDTCPETQFTTLQKHAITLGLSERRACAQIIPDLVKEDQYQKLVSLLTEFKDIPESSIGTLLKYAAKRLNPDSLDMTQNECQECILRNDVENFTLLNSIFKVTFCDALVIPHLREALSVEESLFLLWYISMLLFESSDPMEFENESRLCDWLALIMDAFYQQYLMSKDKKVTDALNRLQSNVRTQITGLCEISSVMAQLQNLKTHGIQNETAELPYSIEIMQL